MIKIIKPFTKDFRISKAEAKNTFLLDDSGIKNI